MTEELTAADFGAAIAKGVVLVDFWAAWCAPCRAIAPVLEELDGARVAKLDVAEHPSIGERYGIRSLPTLIVFRDGEPVQRLYGVKNRRQLQRAIDAAQPSSSSSASPSRAQAISASARATRPS